MLRIRFTRSTMMLLAFGLMLAAGSHDHGQAAFAEPVEQPIDFSFEPVDRQAILALVDEHRRDADATWREQVCDAIYDESIAAGIDPLLVAAIVARESSFRSRVVSHAGAVGLMQLRPFVARAVAKQYDLEWQGNDTLHRDELNVRLGVAYYRELVERFDGDAVLALAAYHRGPTRLQRQLERGTFSGSRYATRVLELYATLSAGRAEFLTRQG